MILLIIMFTASVFAETTTMQFSDPSKPGTIVVTGNGDVTVTGYDGVEVVIETVFDTKENEKNQERELEQNERAKGLRRIAGESVNVVNDKGSNTIQINRSMQNNSDLVLRVPFNTTFKTGQNNLHSTGEAYGEQSFQHSIQNIVVNSVFTGLGGGIMEGDIEITGLTGNIEASTLNGDFILKEVSGSVIVNTVGGDIEVVYKKGAVAKPMSFSTVDGFIDLTLPPSAKADVRIKTVDGDPLTDFDIEMVPITTEERDSGETLPMAGLRYFPSMGNSINGKINGGGPEIRMSSIDGDIYLRKGN